MIAPHSIAESFCRWLAETSLQVALLVIVLLCVEALAWRMFTARARTVLWGLVLLRLVLPPLPAPVASEVIAETKLMTRFAPPSATRVHSPASAPTSADSSGEPGPPITRVATSTRVAPSPVLGFTKDPRVSPVIEPVASVAPAAESRRSMELFLALSWGAGFLVALAITLARELRFRRQLRGAVVCADASLLAEIADAAASIGLKQPVVVLVTDAVKGAAATGIRHARLLLPTDFTTHYSATARRCVLLHELAHVRHRDALVNGALVFLRAAFWFHPLVHVALRRLHEAREELRDHDALSVADAPRPTSYAKTLLEALERGAQDVSTPALAFLRGHDWRRRLTMIQTHGKTSRFVRSASGVAILALGSIVLLGAARPGLVPPAPASNGTATPGLDRIHVESYAKWPEWREELERTLTRVLPEVKLVDKSRKDALSSLAFLASLNVLLDPNVDTEYLERPVDLVATSITTRDAIGLLLDSSGGLGFECFDGGIRIAPRDDLKAETETRFYSLAPFVAQLSDPDVKQETVEHLISLIRSFADPARAEQFDTSHLSIGTYRDLLVLNADRPMHDATKRLLERLLGPIDEVARELPQADPSDAALAECFDKRIALEVHDEPLREVLRQLRSTIAVSIFAPDDFLDQPVQLSVSNRPTRDVLSEIARQVGLHLVVRSGVITLALDPKSTVEIYEIGGLVPQEGEERGWAIDSLSEVIRSQIDPTSWDTHPGFTISIFGDRLIVRQMPENQVALRGMLGALEKALEGGN